MKCILLIALSILSVNVFAADSDSESTSESRTFIKPHALDNKSERVPSIGVSTGLTNTQQGLRNGTSYAAEYGWQTYIPFSAAIELGGYVSDHSTSQSTLTRTRLLGKYNYNLGGTIPVIKDSYAGLGVGPVLDNVRNRYTWEVGVAPQVGFDIPIASTHLSLGANINYLIIIGPNPGALAFNGVAKYWF